MDIADPQIVPNIPISSGPGAGLIIISRSLDSRIRLSQSSLIIFS